MTPDRRTAGSPPAPAASVARAAAPIRRKRSVAGLMSSAQRETHPANGVDEPFARIGILICYDRHFPEAARVLGLGGAEILFVLWIFSLTIIAVKVVGDARTVKQGGAASFGFCSKRRCLV